MGKFKLEDTGDKTFRISGKTFLKGQYIIEYTGADTDNYGVLINPEKIAVFLRPVSNNNIVKQGLFPFEKPYLWTEFIDGNGVKFNNFETFSEILATSIANFNLVEISQQSDTFNYIHAIFEPINNGTVNLINKNYNIINPLGTLLALTVNMPTSPTNNDSVQIKFTQGVTTVTYTGGTIVSQVTTPVAGQLIVLVYDGLNNTWY